MCYNLSRETVVHWIEAVFRWIGPLRKTQRSNFKETPCVVLAGKCGEQWEQRHCDCAGIWVVIFVVKLVVPADCAVTLFGTWSSYVNCVVLSVGGVGVCMQCRRWAVHGARLRGTFVFMLDFLTFGGGRIVCMSPALHDT